jgi:flagellar biosynthetic protein FliO
MIGTLGPLATASRPAHAAGSFRRIAAIAGLTGILIVAAIGALHPLPVAGSQRATSGAASVATTQPLAASAEVGTVWGTSDPMGGLNVVDLATKGTVVLVLLFITLRVLGKMQATAPRKSGRLKVLESRVLAPKASLHLVAVGDRRLVVGLTPNGMVSLAELDAGELEAFAEIESQEATATAVSSPPATGFGQPAFGSVLGSMMAPIDALTGRLAGLLGGGRVR